MIASSVPVRVGKVYRSKLDLLSAFQEISKEAGWDYVSQQMETSETLVHMARVQMGDVLLARTPHQTAKAFGLGVVSLGRTILGHTVATNGITRDVEHQTLELLVRHLDFCLHSRTQQSLDVSRMN